MIQPQRFHIDLGTQRVINKIYYENFHNNGIETNKGVKNFTLWGSNDESAFNNLNYNDDTGWTQLSTSESFFKIHNSTNASDPQYIDVLNNTSSFRYYAFKFADNWGSTVRSGLRYIELINTTSNDKAKDIQIQSESAYNGYHTTMILTENGRLLTAGWNDVYAHILGRAAAGNVSNSSLKEVDGFLNIEKFYLLNPKGYFSYSTVFAKCRDGFWYSWGSHNYCQLLRNADNTTERYPMKIDVNRLNGVNLDDVVLIYTTASAELTNGHGVFVNNGIEFVLKDGKRYFVSQNLQGVSDNTGTYNKSCCDVNRFTTLQRAYPDIKVT